MAARRRVARRTDELTFEQLIELLIGYPQRRSVFACEADREAAYWDHRETLLARDRPATRPAAWWEFEYVGVPPAEDDRMVTLARLGVLSDAEAAHVRQRAAHPGSRREVRRCR